MQGFAFLLISCYYSFMRHMYRLPKHIFILLMIIALVGGVFFVQQTVFAQALGGKLLYIYAPPFQNMTHAIIGVRPSPGVICPICMMAAGAGRWFLGFAAGGVVIRGALGGL